MTTTLFLKEGGNRDRATSATSAACEATSWHGRRPQQQDPVSSFFLALTTNQLLIPSKMYLLPACQSHRACAQNADPGGTCLVGGLPLLPDVLPSSIVFASISLPHLRYSCESLRSCCMVLIRGVPVGVNFPLTRLPLISGVGAVPDLDRVPRVVPETSFGFHSLMSWYIAGIFANILVSSEVLDMSRQGLPHMIPTWHSTRDQYPGAK